MIIECKGGVDVTLNRRHIAQLNQYYAACKTKGLVGVLTNGIQWQFFADPNVPCQMHAEPFLVFDAGDLGKRENLDLLEKLTKPKFDPPAINTIVKRAQVVEGMKAQLGQWLTSPPDDFVTLMAKPFVLGKIGKNIKEEYRGFLKTAIRRYLDEYVEGRLPTTGPMRATVASQNVRESVTLTPGFAGGQTLDEPTEEATPVTAPSQAVEGEQFKPTKPRTIKGADLVNDIRSGMSFDAMSEKYGVSAGKLSQFLHHLVYKGMLRNEELPEQTL